MWWLESRERKSSWLSEAKKKIGLARGYLWLPISTQEYARRKGTVQIGYSITSYPLKHRKEGEEPQTYVECLCFFDFVGKCGECVVGLDFVGGFWLLCGSTKKMKKKTIKSQGHCKTIAAAI